MFGKLTRVAVLLWAVVLFGLILPGHRRGSVPVPGGKVVDTAFNARADAASTDPVGPAVGASKCPMCADWGSSQGKERNGPPKGGSDKCALCYLLATLLQPPPVGLGDGVMGLLGRLPVSSPAQAPKARLQGLVTIRGPPLMYPL
jgi:hypothetical protein